MTSLHHDLVFLTPLSDGRATDLSTFVATQARGTVVDVGCGWAELLLRTLEQGPELEGLGIDLDADSIAHGQTTAEKRGLSDRVELIVADVKSSLPEEVGGVICIGASQIWGPPVEANMPIDYRSALTAVRELLKPGAPVVYGEGIWTAEPTPAAYEPLAGRPDEFVFLPELIDIANECGFGVIRSHQATLDEWDCFESGFTAGYVRWLLEHPHDHPEAEEVAARLQASRDRYYRGYRNIMGMAYLQLLAA